MPGDVRFPPHGLSRRPLQPDGDLKASGSPPPGSSPSDERANEEARQRLLAFACAITIAPLDENTGVWQAAAKAINPSSHRTSLRQPVRDDKLRYERPGHPWGGDPARPHLPRTATPTAPRPGGLPQHDECLRRSRPGVRA